MKRKEDSAMSHLQHLKTEEIRRNRKETQRNSEGEKAGECGFMVVK